MHSCPEAGREGEEVGNMKSYFTFSTKIGQRGHEGGLHMLQCDTALIYLFGKQIKASTNY